MIDWDMTFDKFGINEKTAKTRDKIIVNCGGCHNIFERIYSSVKAAIRKQGDFKCHQCRTSHERFKTICRNNAEKMWSDENYISNNLDKVKATEYKEKKRQESLARWANDEYRAKMTTKEMKELRKKQSSKVARELWQTEDYRAKMTAALRSRMIEQWKREDYRQHMARSQTAITKNLWNSGVFSKCFGMNFAERMKIINTNNLKDPKTKKKLSDASKKNWANQEYIDAVIRGNKKRWADSDYRMKMAVIRSLQPRESNIQKMLYDYLDDCGVVYEKEGSATQVGFYVFDCLVKGKKNILIECQGDYWHSLKRTTSRDKAKFTYIQKYFPEYEIMYIWEHEFYTKDRVLDRLKVKLGLDVPTIDFKIRDVEIREVSSRDVKSFLDAYHYIGKGRGGKCFGAYLGDDLIACVVYSPPIRNNHSKLFGDFVELSRFCIHPSYHKRNLASYVISKSLLMIDKDVISYADTTFGHDGTIYLAANFRHHHDVEPDYWYVDKDGYVMHKRTLYGRATKMKMTEAEFSESFGYTKKFGGIKKCFVYQKR